jgi:tetratricopeptide (TPR) repeat protein
MRRKSSLFSRDARADRSVRASRLNRALIWQVAGASGSMASMMLLPRSKRPVAAVLVLVCAGIGGGWYFWGRGPAPEPPTLDLADADPEVARAVETARAAVVDAPRSGPAWGKLGMVLAVHDFDSQARTCFAHAERFDPRDARWPYLHGSMLRPEAPQEALPLLERAAKLAEQQLQPRVLLAEVLLELDRLDEAERLFHLVLDAEPQLARAHFGLGRVAIRRNHLPTAVEQLREAAELVPAAKPVHALLAEVHHRLGDDKAAREELRLLAEQPDGFAWPDPIVEQMWQYRAGVQAHVTYAGQCLQQGRRDEGIDVLRQTVRDHPSSYDAWLALGRALIQTNQPRPAEEALREAVRLRSDAFEGRLLLATALHQGGDGRGAIEQYRQALALKPQHAVAHHNLGMCYKELDEPKMAIAAFREAVRYKPDLAKAHRELGAILSHCGQDREALAHLEHAVRLAPEDETAQRLLEAVRARNP